ncbi:MAG: carboxypeptidase regulatory-like domain-containing protein, partial [Snodgrassella sp.]|uniref:carboxypeptidase-like regulatory domain-containing protein n=1 Tax=Snodgrassella sp. TaxID=2815304 RepID=UPI00258D5840
TLDAQGQPIKGVKGATIKLQNDGVLTEQYTLNTDKDGIASLSKLPAGIYRYRVSAPNHIDASGRIVIQPDSTTNQHIFLEYQTVNVEFNVTETTIKDVYDINVNASFNTQVPAPVILLEPLSINLGGMQVGEEKTGQITVSNYGLVQADNVSLNLPKTDSRFKYEFFSEVPSVLKPKEKVVISYKVTALDPKQKASAQTGTNTFASLLRAAPADDEEDCTSYEASYQESHQSECPSGDISKGSSSGRFYQYSGKKCSTKSTSWGWAGGGSLGGGGGSFGSSGAGSPAAMPITPGCTPDAPCASGGTTNGGC